MAKFYVREWAGTSQFGGGGANIPQGLVCRQAALDHSGGHQESVAFQDTTKIVEWSCDAICSWAIMQNGDTTNIATVNDVRYPAGSSGLVGVSAGQKISVITNT